MSGIVSSPPTARRYRQVAALFKFLCTLTRGIDYCDLNGSVVVGNKARDACKRSCVCLPENIRPGVLNWDAAQPPRNGWRKRDADEQNELAATAEPEAEQTVLDDSAEAMSEDPSDALGHIVKKQISHDWAIVCEMDGKRHEVMTEVINTLAPHDM